MAGYMDIGLRYLSNLSPIFPTSLRDQIVYASEVRGERPTSVRSSMRRPRSSSVFYDTWQIWWLIGVCEGILG
jgi:hypothetical protein